MNNHQNYHTGSGKTINLNHPSKYPQPTRNIPIKSSTQCLSNKDITRAAVVVVVAADAVTLSTEVVAAEVEAEDVADTTLSNMRGQRKKTFWTWASIWIRGSQLNSMAVVKVCSPISPLAWFPGLDHVMSRRGPPPCPLLASGAGGVFVDLVHLY